MKQKELITFPVFPPRPQIGLPKSKRDTHPISAGQNLANFTAQDPIVLAYSGPIVPPASPEPTAPTMATQDPLSVPKDTSVHDGTMEDLINRLINTTMTDRTTSIGIPDLVYQIRCDQEAHKVTEDVTKGYFVIQGRDFICKSVLQVNEITERCIKAIGCRYNGCESTVEDALYELSGPILC